MKPYTLFSQIDTSSLPHVGANGNGSLFKDVLNVVFMFAGAIAVFVIAYGAFRFVVSRGNPDAVSKARDTIIYALVGLVVVLLGFAIVNFVVGHI